MINLLFVVDNLGCGGAQSITCTLVNYLSQSQSINVTVCTLDNKNQQQELDSKVELIDLKLSHEFSYGKLWKHKVLTERETKLINQSINSRNFDLIVLGFHNGYYLYDYLRQTEKIWFWMHGAVLEKRISANLAGQINNYFRYLRHKKYFKKLLDRKKIIAVSDNLQEMYKKILIHSEFRVIPNGINLPKKNMHSSKEWDVLFIGRLVKLKQVDHAIKAFYSARLTGKMAILGDGPEIFSLKKLVKELNLEQKIEFLGWSNDPEQFIKKSKCVVLCSSSEGSPVSLLEALSLNTPIVSYDSSSSIKLLFNNVIMQPYLVPKQDINKLSLALSSCVNRSYSIPKEVIELIDIKTMGNSFLKLIEL
jgi:glycosyltransferase involved in cell wall biosynthesis